MSNHAVCPVEPSDRHFKRKALLGLEIKDHNCAAKTQFVAVCVSHRPMANNPNGYSLVSDGAEKWQ